MEIVVLHAYRAPLGHDVNLGVLIGLLAELPLRDARFHSAVGAGMKEN